MKIYCILPLLLLPSFAYAQGTFPPVSSPSVPIMKTLDQIEARKPIEASPAVPVAGPHININQPGSYYLTGNITVASGNAIVISSGNVTLDLNGFKVAGPANLSSNNSCIQIQSVPNVTVKNGIVADMGRGIQVSVASCTRIERVNFTGCSTYGIYFTGLAKGSLVSSCIFSGIGNTSTGLTPEAILDNAGGIRVENCIIGEVTSVVAGDPTGGITGKFGSFFVNNSISNCKVGIFGGKYKDNTFYNCTSTFVSGTDAGGNN